MASASAAPLTASIGQDRPAQWPGQRLHIGSPHAHRGEVMLPAGRTPGPVMRLAPSQTTSQGKTPPTDATLAQTAGSLTREERIQTVRVWIQQAEALQRGWEARYAALFGDAPPDGQSDNSASA